MFPLQSRKLIRGCASHIKTGLGCAADYEAVYIPFYIPFSGKVETYHGTQGGNWLRLIRDDNGDKIELAHLSAYEIKSGHANAGQRGGITGNTGTITTGPHLHIQIINKTGQRLDPETYNWSSMPIQMPVTVIANNLNVPMPANALSTVAEMMNTYSRNRIILPFDIKTSAFANVPFAEEFPGTKGPQINWYRENITPLCTGKVSMLLMNDEQWQGNTTGAMTWGDPGRPPRISLHVIETTFIEQAFHELCHALLFITGQKDNYVLNGENRFVVHDYLFKNPPDKYGLLDTIDYTKLEAALKNINPVDKIKIRSIGWNDAEKGLYFPFDTMERRQQVLNKLTGLFPDYELDPSEYNLGKRPWK